MNANNNAGPNWADTRVILHELEQLFNREDDLKDVVDIKKMQQEIARQSDIRLMDAKEIVKEMTTEAAAKASDLNIMAQVVGTNSTYNVYSVCSVYSTSTVACAMPLLEATATITVSSIVLRFLVRLSLLLYLTYDRIWLTAETLPDRLIDAFSFHFKGTNSLGMF